MATTIESNPPAEVEAEIEFGDDSEQSCDESIAESDTTSLSSSVFDYVYENGRRYASHRTGGDTYVLPNDDVEQARLDLAHHYWSLMLRGKLNLADLPQAKKGSDCDQMRALDLGTGTGIWAIDFADANEEWEVIGTDLSPIQPRWVPPNCKFEVDNFEDNWIYGKPFNYIHGRNLVGCVADWSVLFKNCFDNLAPGGILEFQETDIGRAYSEDGSVKPGSPIAEYNKVLCEAGKILGREADITPKLVDFVKAAGFVDVKEIKMKFPVGSWPKDPRQKEIGTVVQEILQTGTEAYGLASLTRVLKWEPAKAKEFLASVVKDFNNRKIHTVYDLHVVIGRKPE
ncbi:S-adenosyl-L-methionine-dependent methyltransferase [Ascobolus immersus RN42]|uniref:S-adenosyl-L-methionine-dependent methyltransferase n=1 Tax=Ascobolus immersus RN42 TaxID=1160509 RepID=A0A3N4IJI8_ASCIM|nr:S-adenosyl-L-methionine-dependent methyltransferase [Ascobolus immersus RN42]